MDGINGLAGTLAGMKEDALDAAKLAGGFVLGVGLAAAVGKALAGTDEKPGFLADVDKDKKEQKWAKYVRSGVPLALGLFLFTKFRASAPALGGANGLGMMGYGLAGILKGALNDFGQKDIAAYIPQLSGFAVDNYESNILGGLGADMSINRYLSPSLNGYSRYPGAPTMVESLQGAPTQFQTLQGAPTSIESLNGLSATLM